MKSTSWGRPLTSTDLDLFLRPLVQVDRLDLGDVDAEVAMDPRTADANKDPQVP